MLADDDPDALDPPVREIVLITGFPGLVARQLAIKIVATDPDARVHLLAPSRALDDAEALVAGLPPDHAARVAIVVGQVSDMDVGLSGAEYRALSSAVTTIHHTDGIDDVSVDKHTGRLINVHGTREVIELATECKRLRRLCHWSTIAVSGKRKGVIIESELDEGQSFHSPYEHSRFRAEVLARTAQRRLPVTVFRPGVIVGDSRTGAIDRLVGPYYMISLIATNATQLRLPAVGSSMAPLHLVPIDYVIDAAYALSIDERAAGKTFHLTDPSPLSTRRIYELVAEHANTRPPRGFIPGGVTRRLLGIPGIGRLGRGPLSFLAQADHHAFYNCQATQDLLAGTGISCPRFDDYVANLVRYVVQTRDARQRSDAQADRDADDPLDPLP